MRVLVQRVAQASVDIGEQKIAQIGHGLLLFVGVAPSDGAAQVDWLAEKCLGLRIFADQDKSMNQSVVAVGGEILVVSQFTLTASVRKGRRPSFASAADPQHAESIYTAFVEKLRETLPVQTGRFGADMQIGLVNDGPVTFLLEHPND